MMLHSWNAFYKMAFQKLQAKNKETVQINQQLIKILILFTYLSLVS